MLIGAMRGSDSKAPSWLRWPIIVGLLCHGFAVEGEMFRADVVHFGFGFAVSTLFFFAALILFVESFVHRLHGLFGIVLVGAGLACIFPLLFPGKVVPAADWTVMFRIHLLLALAAYSLMTIATVQAVIMSMQNRQLKMPVAEEDRFLASMPGLVVMERIFFRVVACGFLCLTAVLVTGSLAAKEVHGVYFNLDHKFILTSAAWALFGVLLGGRFFAGWRAKTALAWFWVGFIVLMIAYLGYSLVLELVA